MSASEDILSTHSCNLFGLEDAIKAMANNDNNNEHTYASVAKSQPGKYTTMMSDANQSVLSDHLGWWGVILIIWSRPQLRRLLPLNEDRAHLMKAMTTARHSVERVADRRPL